MTAASRRRPLITLLAATFLAHSALAAAAAGGGYDPWSAVPAWPTACYSTQDSFPNQVDAGREAIKTHRAQQEAVNQRVSAQGGSGGGDEDPMAMAQRVQAAMMKDPQHAMEMMQSMGATDPAAATQKAQEENDRYAAAQAADKKIVADYKAARKAMLAPALSSMKALAARTKPEHTEAGDVWPEPALREAGTIMQQADNAYVPFCHQWFGPNGKIPNYLKQRREYLANDRIPFLSKATDVTATQEMMGHSTEGFHPIVPYDAVDEYLVLANELFGLRTAKASHCTSFTNCDDEFQLMSQ